MRTTKLLKLELSAAAAGSSNREGPRHAGVNSRGLGQSGPWSLLAKAIGITACGAMALFASISPVRAQEIPAPPYLVNKNNTVVLGVSGDEERMKKLAPRGVKLAPGGTAVVIMYLGNDAYGLPAYSSSWLGLEVDGLDAPGGGKARMMIRGIYGPSSVATALAKYFNYPTVEGSTRVEKDGQRIVAVGSVGAREWMRAELTLKSEPCSRGAGMVHEVTPTRSGSGMQLIKIPNVGDWCPAESATFEINAPASDPLGQLGPLKVLWAGYWVGTFGWGAPEIAK
jgi:hypothetical protein